MGETGQNIVKPKLDIAKLGEAMGAPSFRRGNSRPIGEEFEGCAVQRKVDSSGCSDRSQRDGLRRLARTQFCVDVIFFSNTYKQQAE